MIDICECAREKAWASVKRCNPARSDSGKGVVASSLWSVSLGRTTLLPAWKETPLSLKLAPSANVRSRVILFDDRRCACKQASAWDMSTCRRLLRSNTNRQQWLRIWISSRPQVMRSFVVSCHTEYEATRFVAVAHQIPCWPALIGYLAPTCRSYFD